MSIDWVSGTPFAVLGQSGDGRIELNAYNTPRISMIRQGSAYNNQTEIVRIGDLNGGWGYTQQVYGVALGERAAGKVNITLDPTYGFRIFNNVTKRIEITPDAVLRINDSDGNAVFTFDAAAGADITKKLALSGTASALSIGTTPPTSASAGTGIWLDRTGMYGLASNVVQTKLDAATGAIVAGAGNVTLDVNGLFLARGSAIGNKIRWGAGGFDYAEMYTYYPTTSNTAFYLYLPQNAGTGGASSITLEAQNYVDAPSHYHWSRYVQSSSLLKFQTSTDGGSFSDVVSIGGGAIDLSGVYKVSGTQVVGARATGWGTPTGTLYRTALTNSSTQTQFNQAIMAVITDLISHGLLGV